MPLEGANMMRVSACMMLAATISVATLAQSTEPATAFEIADVHVSPRSRDTGMRTRVRPGRYELHNATMVDLIRLAYSFDADKILGGPAWLDYDRFDVLAKIPSKTPPQDTLKLMLQSLLADRFNLVLHKDTRPVGGFVLSSGKSKPKLKEADASRETGCRRDTALLATAGTASVPMIAYACRNMTMDAFAAALRGMAPDYVANAVVDGTGLKGSWDFEIKWTGRALRQLTTEPVGVTLFDAIDQQLGLKLEEQKIPTPVIVVDQVNDKPTGNLPDLATRFPAPPPMEFEVADIKPSGPAAPGSGLVLSGVQPGGRVNWSRLPLTFAITAAWNILTDDIIGAPKWLSSTPFDIIAKLPADAVPANGAITPLQDLGPALQALLIDRFKMKVHFEDRPVTAYTLVAAKPKLKEADPAGRTGCKATGASGFAVSTPFGPIATDRKITCQNITMAQFADQLQILAGPYIHYPALDGTGIAGAWDFSFTYSAVPPSELAAAPGAPPAGGAASDPLGGTTLFDALEKQLGLKLEMQKRPYPQLVIDHIEEKLTEN
jgi:uncharacterized protein (TIGR03435 family)